MTVAIAIQCRDKSIRMKHKWVRPFYKGMSILELIIKRLKDSGRKNIFVLTTESSPMTIAQVTKAKVRVFIGSEDDVLDRFHKFLLRFDFDGVIRICADNPCIALGLMYPIMNWGRTGKYDYISFKNAMRRHEGLFCEYVSAFAIHDMKTHDLSDYDKMHVTPYIYNNTYYRVLEIPIPMIMEKSAIRLTVDTQTDFNIAQTVYRAIGEQYWANIYDWIENKTQLKKRMNENIAENEK